MTLEQEVHPKGLPPFFHNAFRAMAALQVRLRTLIPVVLGSVGSVFASHNAFRAMAALQVRWLACSGLLGPSAVCNPFEKLCAEALLTHATCRLPA